MLKMSASLITLFLILLQHHPPPPPPSGFGVYSVIVIDEPNTGDQNNFNNRRFNQAVRNIRAIETPDGDQSFIGFCQVYNGVSSGQIGDLNFRNWRFLVNYTANNSAIAAACNVDVDSACQLADSNGLNINRIRRCRNPAVPLPKELKLFLIISFAIVCLKKHSQTNKLGKNTLKREDPLK